MKIRSLLVPAVSVLLLVSLGQGCAPFGQKAAEKAAEKAIERNIRTGTGKDVDVDLNSGSLKLNDQDGTSMALGENLSFPPNFPDDIPRYQNGELAFVTANEQENSFGYTMGTTDAKDEVISWFKTAAEEKGYTRTAYVEAGPTVMMGYERTASEGERTLSVTVAENDDGQTSISVVSSVD